MRYVIFVNDRDAPTQRFRVEKVQEESAWDLKEKRKISSFTNFFFFVLSEFASEQEQLNSITEENNRINIRGEIEEKKIYILGHEFENNGNVYNPLTGATLVKRDFAPLNVVVIENV